MSVQKKSKTFEAKVDSLPLLMGWIESVLAHTKAPISQIQLAVEEAFVNVINHSYKGKEGQITLSCCVSDDEVIFEVRDQGTPFNPLTAEHFIDTEASLKARKEGGLGLMLMKKFMTSLDYKRDGNENILILKKELLQK